MQKAMRGLETGLDGWDLPKNWKRMSRDAMLYKLRVPNPERFTGELPRIMLMLHA
jgi:carbamoyl-phosphate synthase large subunit